MVSLLKKRVLLKNEFIKIFCTFRAFQYALKLKTKTRKRLKSTDSFVKQKIHITDRSSY